MRLKEHFGITSDFFTYVLTYLVSGFPAEDQMSSERAISDLLRMTREAIELCKNEETKQLLASSSEQLVEAQQCEKYDISGTEKHLKMASEFFEDARKGKRL